MITATYQKHKLRAWHCDGDCNMRVGDLVRMKSIPNEIGLISWVSPSADDHVTYDVWVEWSTPTQRGRHDTHQFSFQLEVISASR